jgi:hypothetical protein
MYVSCKIALNIRNVPALGEGLGTLAEHFKTSGPPRACTWIAFIAAAMEREEKQARITK